MRLEEFVDRNGKQRIRWQCPYCPHRWDFHAGDRDYIGFLAVHHLVKKHKMNAVAIRRHDSSLGEATREYPGLAPPRRISNHREKPRLRTCQQTVYALLH